MFFLIYYIYIKYTFKVFLPFWMITFVFEVKKNKKNKKCSVVKIGDINVMCVEKKAQEEYNNNFAQRMYKYRPASRSACKYLKW